MAERYILTSSGSKTTAKTPYFSAKIDFISSLQQQPKVNLHIKNVK